MTIPGQNSTRISTVRQRRNAISWRKRKANLVEIVPVVLVLTFLCNSAGAGPSLTFAPATQTTTPGDSVSVGLAISGLGDYAPDSLSTFDFDVRYDPAILDFTGAAFGDPVWGDQLDLFGLGFNITDVDDSGPGVVNLFELSWDLPDDLDALQPGSFVLATLDFQAIGTGTSLLTFDSIVLGDSWAAPLAADCEPGAVTVVPVPAAMLLTSFGLSLVGFATRRRRTATMHE